MEIKIIRFGRYHHAVSGRLLIDGQHVCDTLEQDNGSLPEGSMSCAATRRRPYLIIYIVARRI